MKAAAKQWGSLGYYEPLNEFTHNFPAWRLMSNNTERYLYRSTSGNWLISSTLGDTAANFMSKTISDSPLTQALKWRYWNGSVWADDNSLRVLRFDNFLGKFKYNATWNTKIVF